MLFQSKTSSINFSYPANCTPIDITCDSSFIRTSISWRILSIPSLVPILTWKEYVNRLLEWDLSLIQDQIIIWESEFLQQLKQDDPFLICSNGGAVVLSGSYASAIASNNKILIVLRGRAFRLLPCSFRA